MYTNLRLIRTEKSVTAKKMSELLSLKTKAAYYKKEIGMVNFTLNEAKIVADFFGMPIEEIFFNTKGSL